MGRPGSHILVHGHRGARAVFPENSLAAFAYAIDAGADAVELDIAATRDGVLVVSHDPVLAGPRQVIRDTLFAGLRGRIPPLEEVFRLVAPSRVELNLELKSYPQAPHFAPSPAAFVSLLVNMITAHRFERRVMVQSFDFRVLRAMRELAPEIRRGALFDSTAGSFAAIARRAAFAHYVAPHYPLVSPETVQDAHSAGVAVIPWTVNRPADWGLMASAGVDGMITDDPAALLAWLRHQGLR